MNYYTHLAFSFLVGILLINYLSIPNQILFIILFMGFSLLPDIDKVQSKISEKIKVVSFIIRFFLGHRGLMHSIWIPLLFYLMLFAFNMNIAIAVSFGYLSHLLLDGLTPSGVKLLWPINKKLKGFVRTSSLMEYLLFILLVILDVYFLVSL
jgi:inner membrane protein